MKVIKKLCASLLTLLLLCGLTSQSAWAAEASTPPTPIPENETSEIGQPPELTEPEVTIPPATVDDGMPHGLIMMVQNKSRSYNHTNVINDVTVQIYTIDPVTGEQKLWSEFKQPYPAIDMSCTTMCGNRNQFNYNYTKMAVNQRNIDLNNPTATHKSYGGWIDQDGTFYNLNEMLPGLNRWGYAGKDYVYLNYSSSEGFCGSNDIFCFDSYYIDQKDSGKQILTSGYYYTTEEEANQGIYHPYGSQDAIRVQDRGEYYIYRFSKDFLSSFTFQLRGAYPPNILMATDYAEPTKTFFVVDYIPKPEYSFLLPFPAKGSTSVIYDTSSGQVIDYLPDGYHTDAKSEWGGVVSPDGSTIAYLTVPGTKGKVSMEFVDISQFLASGLNPASRGIPVKKEFAEGPIKDGEWNTLDYMSDGPSCTFLEWRP